MNEFPSSRSVFICEQSQNVAIYFGVSLSLGLPALRTYVSERMRSVKSAMDAGSSAWAGLGHQNKLNAFSFLLINFG